VPTEGKARVSGFDVTKDRDAVRRSIGVVFQEPALDNKLTGSENLDFHAMMYGLTRRDRTERIREVLELVDLSRRADVLVENYSGGMKRRLEIARGFVHRPQVLFLDEPTLGLDPQTRRHIWEYIRRLNREQHMTIILTTHYMEEADFLCDRIAIMDEARFVAMDTARRLKDVLGGDVVTLELDGDEGALAIRLDQTPWVKGITRHDRTLRLTMEHAEKKVPELVAIAHETGAVIDSVEMHKPSLEDVFLHFTGKTIRESDAGSRERLRGRIHGGRSR
jgi:ABC-2 type transport system ATP-binding protein